MLRYLFYVNLWSHFNCNVSHNFLSIYPSTSGTFWVLTLLNIKHLYLFILVINSNTNVKTQNSFCSHAVYQCSIMLSPWLMLSVFFLFSLVFMRQTWWIVPSKKPWHFDGGLEMSTLFLHLEVNKHSTGTHGSCCVIMYYVLYSL